MTGLDTRLQAVYHLFKRLDKRSVFHIILGKRRHGQANDLTFGITDSFQFFFGSIGKMQLFIVHFLHGFRNVDSMVGKSLQVADDVQ